MNKVLVELGAIAAIAELICWSAIFYSIYRRNRGKKNVQ